MNSLSTYIRRHHIALLALFVALGGTSYAAVSLAPNSVGSREVKDGSIKKKDLREQLVSGLGAKAGPAGPTGPAGPQGPQGEPGQDAAPATVASVRVRKASDTQVVPGDNTSVVVDFTDASSEQYDFGNMFDQATDPTVLTIPVTGTYIVTGGVRWQGNPAGVRNLNLHGPQPGGIRASSSVLANTAEVPPFGGGPPVPDTTRQTVATTERFNAGDEIFMSVSQTSGVDLFLDASQNQIHLSAAFIGP